MAPASLVTLGRVAPLRWGSLTWEEFVNVLGEYRRHFYLDRNDEEHAYLRAREALDGLEVVEVADATPALVTFLNEWACRLPTDAAIREIAAWIRAESRSLAEHQDSSIADPRVPRRASTYTRLHEGLLKLKSRGVNTMGVAATSKVLHQINPSLFVMWDKQIQPYADGYGHFMAQMHALAVRLQLTAPPEAQADLEAYLQNALEYPIRKTLAKYLDEYNWYVAVGSERATR